MLLLLLLLLPLPLLAARRCSDGCDGSFDGPPTALPYDTAVRAGEHAKRRAPGPGFCLTFGRLEAGPPDLGLNLNFCMLLACWPAFCCAMMKPTCGCPGWGLRSLRPRTSATCSLLRHCYGGRAYNCSRA
jgi:hypothetical protein